MKMVKKLVAVVAALTLTIGMATTAMAGSWSTYFGLNKGWYEGAKGKMAANSDSGWTAKLQSIGWGGCWGGQVFKKGVSIKKGQQYTIKFNIKSSKLDKWVYLKIGDAKGKKMNLGKWIDCRKGKTVSVNETFTAKYDGNSVYFGIGGDFHDRDGVKTDEDVKVRYKYAPNKKLDARLPSDYSADHPTTISVTGYSFGAASTNSASNNGSSSNGTVVNSNGTVNTVTTSDGTVATGDFTPIACGATAVLAAAAIVVFAKRRQED